MGEAGWKALGYSFLASAGLTVRDALLLLWRIKLIPPPAPKFASFLFPVIFAIPVFDVLGNLASGWLWT